MNQEPPRPQGIDPTLPQEEELVREVLPVVTTDTQTLRPTTSEGTFRIKVESASQTLHVGPLPTPEDFAAYNSTVPGAAKRLLAMAEREQRHGQAMDRNALKGMLELGRRGQNFAMATTLGLALSAFILAILGHDTVAIVTTASAMVPVTLAFLGRSTQSNPPSTGKSGDSQGQARQQADLPSQTRQESLTSPEADGPPVRN